MCRVAPLARDRSQPASPAQRCIAFTRSSARGKCGVRAVKGFSRQAYENGVVIVRCPGCQSQHLVADRYGWFGAPGDVEDFLASRGEAVTRAAADLPGEEDEGTLEIDQEQLRAWIEKTGVRGGAGAGAGNANESDANER